MLYRDYPKSYEIGKLYGSFVAAILDNHDKGRNLTLKFLGSQNQENRAFSSGLSPLNHNNGIIVVDISSINLKYLPIKHVNQKCIDMLGHTKQNLASCDIHFIIPEIYKLLKPHKINCCIKEKIDKIGIEKPFYLIDSKKNYLAVDAEIYLSAFGSKLYCVLVFRPDLENDSSALIKGTKILGSTEKFKTMLNLDQSNSEMNAISLIPNFEKEITKKSFNYTGFVSMFPNHIEIEKQQFIVLKALLSSPFLKKHTSFGKTILFAQYLVNESVNESKMDAVEVNVISNTNILSFENGENDDKGLAKSLISQSRTSSSFKNSSYMSNHKKLKTDINKITKQMKFILFFGVLSFIVLCIILLVYYDNSIGDLEKLGDCDYFLAYRLYLIRYLAYIARILNLKSQGVDLEMKNDLLQSELIFTSVQLEMIMNHFRNNMDYLPSERYKDMYKTNIVPT